MVKYTINNFNKDYPNDDSCLERIFEARYSELKDFNKYYKVAGRKCYAHSETGEHIYPLAGTIFHKSSTSLKNWFFAIFLFSNSKNGVSAKELERQIGVTYKTAWRMAKQIRLLFQEVDGLLENTIELDETYMGGKGGNNKRGRGAENKTPVFGMVERQGVIKARVTVDTKRKTVMPIIRENIKIGSQVMTDEYLPYRSLSIEGYAHQVVSHGVKEYVRGNVHTNTLEGFWSQLKRSISGTYHAVSPAYLQSYVNEFSFRYNLRKSEQPIFHLLLAEVSAV